MPAPLVSTQQSRCPEPPVMREPVLCQGFSAWPGHTFPGLNLALPLSSQSPASVLAKPIALGLVSGRSEHCTRTGVVIIAPCEARGLGWAWHQNVWNSYKFLFSFNAWFEISQPVKSGPGQSKVLFLENWNQNAMLFSHWIFEKLPSSISSSNLVFSPTDFVDLEMF